MASGAVPVVRRWQGAAEMYPDSVLFETPEEAARQISEIVARDRWAAVAEAARGEANRRFDCRVILPQVEQALLGQSLVIEPALVSTA